MEKKKQVKTKTDKTGDMDFESALKELEEIAQTLERGEMGLEESIRSYEKGMKLAQFCHKKLEEAERKIEILQKEDGDTVSRPVRAEEDSGEIADDDDMQGSLL